VQEKIDFELINNNNFFKTSLAELYLITYMLQFQTLVQVYFLQLQQIFEKVLALFRLPLWYSYSFNSYTRTWPAASVPSIPPIATLFPSGDMDTIPEPSPAASPSMSWPS